MKKINKIDKMRRIQRKGIKYLEGLGFLVHLNFHTRWQKDIFFMWDAVAIATKNIICKDFCCPCGDVIWIQFKSGYVSNKKEYQKWCSKLKQNGLLMQYLGRNKWKIEWVV